MTGTAAGDDRLLFPIEYTFTIQGRPGLVLASRRSSGGVRTGDAVRVIHGGRSVVVECRGWEMGHGRDPDGKSFPFNGIHVVGLRRFDPLPGDEVRNWPD